MQDCDFTSEQAGAVTEAIKTATGGLVTKADLQAAKSEITSEIHKTAAAQTWRYVMFVGVLMAILRYMPVGCDVPPP